jgi:hypothetical protein
MSVGLIFPTGTGMLLAPLLTLAPQEDLVLGGPLGHNLGLLGTVGLGVPHFSTLIASAGESL